MLEAISPQRPSSNERDAVLAALNGVIGDQLQATGNPLATPMSFRHQGSVLTAEHLKALAAPTVNGKILLLIHGLCMNDLQWTQNLDGSGTATYDHGQALARTLGYTPVYLRYNSGLHTSQNGRALAAQLEQLIRDWPVPVLYVAGNHEFYGHRWEQLRQDLQTQCLGTSIRFLDNSRFDLGEVRFLGATLWTDFSQSIIGVDRSMRCARARLADFGAIQTQTGLFTPEQSMKDHAQSVQWLTQQLEKPHAGQTVVITHHAPHPLSIHLRYRSDLLNAAFASNLTPLLVQSDLWLHGHVHDSFDYRVGRCRVVANPAGYIENRASLPWLASANFENPHFDACCVIDSSLTGES
jgi:hypothetical protein